MRRKLLTAFLAVFLFQNLLAGVALAACGIEGATGTQVEAVAQLPCHDHKGANKAVPLKQLGEQCKKCSVTCISIASLPSLVTHRAERQASTPPAAPDTAALTIDPFNPLRPPIA